MKNDTWTRVKRRGRIAGGLVWAGLFFAFRPHAPLPGSRHGITLTIEVPGSGAAERTARLRAVAAALGTHAVRGDIDRTAYAERRFLGVKIRAFVPDADPVQLLVRVPAAQSTGNQVAA